MVKEIVDAFEIKTVSSVDFKYSNKKNAQDANFQGDALGSFQEAIGTVLVATQFWGIMPVIGIKGRSASELHFKWSAWRTRLFLALFTLLIGYVMFAILLFLKVEFSLERIIPVIIHSSSAAVMWCFCTLAKQWPQIMLKWEAVEAMLPKYRTQKEKSHLRSRINRFAIIFFICAAIEDILTATSTAYYVKTCEPDQDLTKRFFEWHLEHIFRFINYKLWKGLFGKSIRILGAFVWNYMNLFIMIISVGLSSRLQQFNEELKRIKGRPMCEDYWEIKRAQYRSLGDLCKIIDEAIAPITIISLGNNLFCVCVQLMRSLRPKLSAANAIYFWFSLIFLLIRTITFLLFAAQVHEESKKPVDILRAVPKSVWCKEVERFIEEVVFGTIALSGMRFFFFTRKLIITAAGTILTYELVLMQFQGDETEMLCQRHD